MSKGYSPDGGLELRSVFPLYPELSKEKKVTGTRGGLEVFP